jgi:RNA polymerase sigma-70 factor (ECF subfamily)
LAQFVQPALVNGTIGLLFAPRGRLSRVLRFKIVREKIVEAEVIADRERLGQLNVAVLED